MKKKLCKSNFFYPNRSDLNLYIIPLKTKKGGKMYVFTQSFGNVEYATMLFAEEY